MKKIKSILLLVIFLSGVLSAFSQQIATDYFRVNINTNSPKLWSYTIKSTKEKIDIQAPVFEIDGKAIQATFKNSKELQRPALRNGAKEYAFEGELNELTDVKMTLIIRAAQDNPIIRFKYQLSTAASHKLTKNNAADNISYAGLSLDRKSTRLNSSH